MLEGFVAWVLNNYLGKYVENLNTDQLSIALLSGKVELENLPLRKDALRSLELPVEIKSGFIGKVKLQIPVRQIRSAPWVIAIEQLYLIASPLTVDKWDAHSEETTLQELKINALDTLEARWRFETESKDTCAGYYASSYTSWLNFGTGVVSDILENIQLNIQDVHIRYEDTVSIPGKRMAFGITLESLSVQSCDSNWVPGFSHWAKGNESFKLLDMQKFAVYWDELADEELLSDLTLGELAVAMSPLQTAKIIKNYILSPVSASAHFKRNRSEQPLRSVQTPRIVCDLLMEDVPLTLVDWQYDQLVKSIKGLNDVAIFRSYRRYRPSCPIKEDPFAWWIYAINCLYPGKQPSICKERPTWESCLAKAKENVQYVAIYKKVLSTPTIILTPAEKELKESIEWEREFDELKILRELTMRSVPLPSRNVSSTYSTGRSMLVSRFPNWLGWYSSSPNETVSPETTQLEGEILQALADSVENNTLLRRDAVFGQFNFCLKKGSLDLCTKNEETDESAPMLELEFKNLSLNILSKPRTASHLIELSLGALHLKDKITLNSLFPVLVGPPGAERLSGRGKASTPKVGKMDDCLFYLAYEKKPSNSVCDYRLCIRSKSLDVVYQPNAVRWLTEFLCLPHQRNITYSRIEAMKSKTKKELIKNWEQILDGRLAVKKSWELELDISAPQIIFVAQFCDKNSAMAVIDFGRLQLRNNVEKPAIAVISELVSKEAEEDEMFLTPCSTPPQSEASDSDEQITEVFAAEQLPEDPLTEISLHNKLYDRYCVELTDLQILVGRVKDNWRSAHNKGTSTMHVLDRFNISLQIERRVIHTTDPRYPSLTLSANLPKLVAHVNESKVNSVRTLFHIISATGLPSPFQTPDDTKELIAEREQDDEESTSLDTSVELSRLLMVQFTIDRMSLELQSRGRCVAELQVAGVRASLTKRPVNLNITLTVHSLLLVDALQTFGPDFELLVASHKHVGMDSMSGSLRDSEPTSPVSPASPDPNLSRAETTSPLALSQALNSLSTSPPRVLNNPHQFVSTIDHEALIMIDIAILPGQEQIANIQCNTLDIIANQETIVELVGFIQRIFPKTHKATGLNLQSAVASQFQNSCDDLTDSVSQDVPHKLASTHVTFDFYRLNVLLLRGVVKDGNLYGKKICTATMNEAKIEATVEDRVEVKGSLGGLQILDLTPEGYMHQRIVSVGRDPLLENPHPLYTMSYPQNEGPAFSFGVVRRINEPYKDVADVTIRMASLWYTHSPQFLVELQSCATEFKQYMANAARSIRTAATDMALGLVHARTEALAQSLYLNTRLSSSLYGSALSFNDVASPRKRRRSNSAETSSYYSIPQTPYSNGEIIHDFVIDIKLDIELDSPVVVLPRSSNSPEVIVAHLGKIRAHNKYEDDYHMSEYDCVRIERHDIEVRDMNLFSLDISSRRVPGPMVIKSEVLYSCETLAKPILHDTVLQLSIIREVNMRQNSESNLLIDDDDNVNYNLGKESIQINGTVVTALKVSLTRSQYEQVLDTLRWLTQPPPEIDPHGIPRTTQGPQTTLDDISEEDIGVPTLNMDPHVRAKMFQTVRPVAGSNKTSSAKTVALKLSFDLPMFTVQLRGDSPNGEQALVDLSFRDFVFNYEKCHRYETNIQVSLRSIFMEDLLQPEDSKQRAMVVSSSGNELPVGSSCVSKSCPDVTYYGRSPSLTRGSLPDHLETTQIFGTKLYSNRNVLKVNGNYPCTPPPSPSQGRDKPEKNLVIISTLLVDPAAPNFDTNYHSTQRSTSVDFNCLDLVVSVESWVMVLDFFSAAPSRKDTKPSVTNNLTSALTNGNDDHKKGSLKCKEETNVTVRSLTVVLVKPDRDLAKANISNVDLCVKTTGSTKKEVDGKLGSMSLLDLTLHGQLYRERFLTTGKQALQFTYVRHSNSESVKLGYDAQLKIQTSSVMYVHTKRFVAEIQAFFNHFSQLQSVMRGIRVATSGQTVKDDPLKLSLLLQAGSPIILLPVSSKSTDLLIADFGELLVSNSFKLSGESGTISTVNGGDPGKKCLLDVMKIELQNMDLYTASKEKDFNLQKGKQTVNNNNGCLKLGSSLIVKSGPSLLTKKFQLSLQVERNLNCNVSHNVPDMSIYGRLSTLDGALDLAQYRLIRGLLAFNLGEDTERILPSVNQNQINMAVTLNMRDVWTLSSLKLDLENVTLRLQTNQSSPPLACVNFIKSILTIETFSNFSQDIDLVSQEILIMDSRFDNSPPKEKSNVFTNILQPVKYSKENNNLVQVEVHSRKRQDRTKFTILLNNMRLMAIFDWWEAAREFILINIENEAASPENQKVTTSKPQNDYFELKMNITDSEIVVVENTSQWDSNSVILKSTTVITYKPSNVEKPLSCNLNNCEMFSCILGLEEETALSIIDPVTLNIDVNKEGVLEVQLQFLTVRLSYHDMCMFAQMLNSIPKQMLTDKSGEENQTVAIKNQITKLTALGFSKEDSLVALENCNNTLDDAALWLTQNARAIHSGNIQNQEQLIDVKSIEVKANCISICIIDDCGDSDVPLMELTFSKLNLRQHFPEIDIQNSVFPQGTLECILASDYYNRVLSGWEPIIEPWKCGVLWEKSLTSDLRRNRFNIKVESQDVLDVNITSTFMELYKQVKENWTRDYYRVKENDQPSYKPTNSPGYRTRSPFVPFAIKNDTGSQIHFKTLISDINSPCSRQNYLQDESWVTVAPGETVPFTFTSRDKMRHQDSHKMKLHQLGVKADDWQPVSPVTVDKVGTYFRHASVQIQHRSQRELPPARIVFDITLEGSARKLVTVRSALLLINKLPHNIDLKLESRLPYETAALWVAASTFTVETGSTLPIPLKHAHSQITVRPCGFAYPYTFCIPSISWIEMPDNADRSFMTSICHTHKGHTYRFAVELIREKHLLGKVGPLEQPAHRIVLLPIVKLINLLPIEICYVLQNSKGNIEAGCNASVTDVDPEQHLELDVSFENFKTSAPIIISSGTTSEFACKIRMEDRNGRKLYLNAIIAPNKGAKLKITLSASYWIINKTGLPLVFRQSGASVETAGQFEEHEVARMVEPLLFSFSDQDASPTINARVGKHVVSDGRPQWCNNFHCQKGTQVRKLHVTMKDGKPDTVFVVGIEVRPGKGKYRFTHIVTVSPRYQLYNRSSYALMFSQLFFTGSNQTESREQRCFLRSMPSSHMPFHWPRLDKDQLLCVTILDIPDCCWSGGLMIDDNYSAHVNVRDTNGRVYFLRLEVLLQGATFFIVFTDADTMPPPLRIDNFSEVSLSFFQACCKDLLQSTARAHSSVPYAWDQPTGQPYLTVMAPGGVTCTYDMNRLGAQNKLTYENFIYIAFTETFKEQLHRDPFNLTSQELVLDVTKGNQVVLSRKMQGQRSQLWRMTPEGHLQHEGSSPPSHPNQPHQQGAMLVLDIDNTALQPHTYSRLMLRRLDPRRRSTQTWRFTEEGRLCCGWCDLCVQAQDGFFGLRQGNAAVVGMPQPICHKINDKGVPVEQAVGRQKLRPGSGLLSVEIIMDGPTRVLCVKDMKERSIYATSDERDWASISLKQRPNLTGGGEDEPTTVNRELQLTVNLQGLGISLVCRKTPEELIYALFSHIVGETVLTPVLKRFCVSVRNVQVDNQLFETSVPVVLHVTPLNVRNNDEAQHKLPAIEFNAEMPQQVNENAVIFKHFILHLKKITVILEERLMLKLFAFLGFNSGEEELLNNREDNDLETQRLVTEVSAAHAKRYYFGLIQLVPDQIRLSVKTVSKLPPHLHRIKRKLGLTLIKFEDAAVDLQAYDKRHPFETSQFLFNSILKHFKDELMWQAGIILGSVDFLGNPLGFMNDVSEGFSGLIEGNVGALVKNVAHGLSNSTAKVTESLSDGLGRIAMDDQHEEIRQKIRQVESGRSRDHIAAGFKGLGFGFLGGATGIFKQVYEGASSDGIQGVFSGIGKGLVGAVTKPVVGVLDFASETARAVRDSSKSKVVLEKYRYPRCVHGPGGLLPRYNPKQSQGQLYLYTINEKDYKEHLVAYEVLGGSEDFQCIVSNEKLRIISMSGNSSLTPFLECHLSDLETCNIIVLKEGSEERYYVEIVMHVLGTSSAVVNPDPVKKPRVRCRTYDVAKTVMQQINYAKRLYVDHLYTLNNDNIVNYED